jgi:hypothetical protein
MNNNLKKLNKEQLLNIISKMKKSDLIEVINNKIGGGNSTVLKETNNAIRKAIVFNESKIKKTQNNTMENDTLYNKIYEP